MSGPSVFQLLCSLAMFAIIAPTRRGQAPPVIDNLFGGIGFTNIVAPGEAVNVDGTNLAGPSGSPTRVVLVNGVSTPIVGSIPQNGVFLAIQIPPQTPIGSANILVSVNGISSSPFQVKVRDRIGESGHTWIRTIP